MSEPTPPTLLAACWTWAGDAGPGHPAAAGGADLLERVDAAAAAGWTGLGFSDDDLRYARDSIGFDQLRDMLDDRGITSIEVEFLDGWWRSDTATEAEQLLSDAAAALRATRMKAGVPERVELDTVSISTVVTRLTALTTRFTVTGAQVALEATGTAGALTIEQVLDLVGQVQASGVGAVVDIFQLAKAGIPLDVLRTLDWDRVVSVELGDAIWADGQLVERCLPGDGDIDLVGFIREVRAAGWDEYWGVEIISSQLRQLPQADGVRRVRDGVLGAFRTATAPA